MIEKTINQFHSILVSVPTLLFDIDEVQFSSKIHPDKWSKKEILGHLIDSATNNHQRIIRAQFESTPEISYNQNEWNSFNFYQELDLVHIINFWIIYNVQLYEIIRRIPKENLLKQVRVGGKIFSLESIVIDYVEHLEHHLKQIIDPQK